MCDSCWNVIRRFHELYEMVGKISREPVTTQSLCAEPLVYLDVEVLDENADMMRLIDDDGDWPVSIVPDTTVECLDAEQANAEMVAKNLENLPQILDNTTTPSTNYTIVESPSIVAPKKQQRKGPLTITDEINARIRSALLTMSCELCPTEFVNVVEVNRHYRDKHSQAGFLRCCEQKHITTGSLLRHVEQFHENFDDDTNNTGALACAFCSYRSTSIRNVKNHLDLQHRVFGDFTQYSCDICQKM